VPTYQYQCTECGNALEVHQSFTDDALTVCPTCEGRLRKVFNAVGVVFKGSGFYKTDSRAGAGSGASSSSEKTSSTSSEKSSSGDGGSSSSSSGGDKGSGSSSSSASTSSSSGGKGSAA
jgi:putative FmdB family regulatory protein